MRRLHVLLVLALVAAASAQRTLRVPSQYNTIQAAINAARAKDTVLVDPGRYVENLNIQKAITVRSRFGAPSTILDGGGRGGVVNVAAVQARVEGFTVTNGKAAFGGGISTSAGAVIASCVVTGNTASTAGGGFQCFFGSVIVGCTVVNNSAGAAGGFSIIGPVVITNCCIWNNRAQQWPEIWVQLPYNPPTVTYSNVKGGFPGSGNLNVDPRFVDEGRADFHLRVNSPLIGKGTVKAPGAVQHDYEGDPWPAVGPPDIGADLFYRHVYVTGSASPGGTIVVKVIGNPGSPVLVGYGLRMARQPIPIPGLEGALLIDPSPMGVLGLPRVGAAGITWLTYSLPANLPKTAYPFQALVGTQFTSLYLLVVR